MKKKIEKKYVDYLVKKTEEIVNIVIERMNKKVLVK